MQQTAAPYPGKSSPSSPSLWKVTLFPEVPATRSCMSLLGLLSTTGKPEKLLLEADLLSPSALSVNLPTQWNLWKLKEVDLLLGGTGTTTFNQSHLKQPPPKGTHMAPSVPLISFLKGLCQMQPYRLDLPLFPGQDKQEAKQLQFDVISLSSNHIAYLSPLISVSWLLSAISVY